MRHDRKLQTAVNVKTGMTPSHPYDLHHGDQDSVKERLLRGPRNRQMGCFISFAPSIFFYAFSQCSLKFPINLCFLYNKDSNWYPSQKEQLFWSMRMKIKGYILCPSTLDIPWGRELSGLNFLFEALLLKDLPSHSDWKSYI